MTKPRMTYYICPFHNDSNPSLVIYQESMRYKCYGCGKHGLVDDKLMDKLDEPVQVRATKVNKEDYGTLSANGEKFLVSRNISKHISTSYKITEKRGHDSPSLYIPIYDIMGKESGYQIRFLDPNHTPKIKNYPDKDGHYPKYGAVYMDEMNTEFYLVESTVDALSLYSQYKLPSLVLLGTKISDELMNILTGLPGGRCNIWLDPDAIDLAYFFRDSIRATTNLMVSVIDNGRKPYENMGN